MLQNQLFKVGKVLITAEAADFLRGLTEKIGFTERSLTLCVLVRDATGDWDSMTAEDRAANRHAVKSGGLILSAFDLADFGTLFVRTEPDRSVTTILLRSDY